jgi:hypothetical protein
MPKTLPTSTSLVVISRASRLGQRWPDGWLWAGITKAALAFIAGSKTFLGWIGQEAFRLLAEPSDRAPRFLAFDRRLVDAARAEGIALYFDPFT